MPLLNSEKKSLDLNLNPSSITNSLSVIIVYIEYRNLSDIKVINSVEYYRSVDALETVSYFGGDTRPSPIKYEVGVERLIGGFEVLIFDYQSSKNIFIKYPTLDHFIELYGGGIGSGRGDMKTGHASNIWEKEPWNYNIQFMRHGQNMFLMLGKNSTKVF